MSRIEEALRRARSSTADTAPAFPAATRLTAVVETDEADIVAPAAVAKHDVAPPDIRADVVAPPYASIDGQLDDVVLESMGPASIGDAQFDCDLRPEEASPTLRGHTFGPTACHEKLILNPDIAPAVLEQYRKVATSLHQLQLERQIKIVMIASPMAEDGKTLTASNIALTLSESFRRSVLLIDADLRRPSIHTVFGTPNVTGLNDALTSEREEKLTVFEATPRLSILPSGRPNADPMSCLTSERMRLIIAEAGTKFDWVIIDTPPVGVLSDAKLLAEMVHAVVLVIGAGKTPFRTVQRAIEAIDRKRIAGVVLNRVTEQQPGSHYYDYYTTARRD